MTGIDRVGRGLPGVVVPRAARAEVGAGFAMPAAAEADAAPAGSGAVAPIALESWLTLQAAEEGSERDRSARRRGQALLSALSRLQMGMLSGGDSAETLAALRTLVADVPIAWDPGLAAAVDHVVLRARLELARGRG